MKINLVFYLSDIHLLEAKNQRQPSLLPEIKLQSFTKFKASDYSIKVNKDILDERLSNITKEYKSFEDKRNDTKSEIGWGHQIRSYVLQPYQMVKDLRTNVEDGNTQAVLDGRIDKFLTSALSRKIS